MNRKALLGGLLGAAVAGAGPAGFKFPNLKATPANLRHGRAGILQRIREARTLEAVDALLTDVHASGASAKTIRKAVRAAAAARERLEPKGAAR